ncbi:RNA polymerase sigma factor [Frankia sp. AiPs1]|nr:RNA polymerase sigma factor [Frankia sp. AiPs1]MCM3920708.1 RNA polymerase sigma factor [Frankia sp. AiPs1]
MSESAETSAGGGAATSGIPRQLPATAESVPTAAGVPVIPAPPTPIRRTSGGASTPFRDSPDTDPPPTTEPDLSSAVSGAQRGDEASFRLIYRTVQPGLLRYLRVLVGDDAEDVASEAWLQIARDLPTFRGDADGFRGWAATIARHRALDHLRRRGRRQREDVPVELVTAQLAGPDDTAGEALEAMSTEAALRLITGLPLDQAEAVLLRVVMGLEAKTAGRVLGKRAGAVRTAAHRGLRRLAEQLGAVEHPGERGDQQDRSARSRRT